MPDRIDNANQPGATDSPHGGVVTQVPLQASDEAGTLHQGQSVTAPAPVLDLPAQDRDLRSPRKALAAGGVCPPLAAADDPSSLKATPVVRLDAVPTPVAAALQLFDEDGDGVVDLTELQHAADAWRRSKQQANMYKSIVIFGGIAIMVLMACMLGMTYTAVQLSKDMHVASGSAALTNNEGQVVQVASSDITIGANGALMLRQSDDSAGASASTTAGRMLSGEEAPNSAHAGAGRLQAALGVRQMYQQREMSSTMPDEYFKELQWLELESAMGSTVSLKISSVVRVPRSTAACGSVLILVTSVGRVVLDDKELSFDHSVGQLFSEAGFPVVKTAGGSAAASEVVERMAGAGNGRRLQGAVTLVGFFNVIDDREWTCSTVTKPSLPPLFSARSTAYTPCKPEADVGADLCRLEYRQEEFEAPGVVDYQGGRYFKQQRQMYFNATDAFTVETNPAHPGALSVKHVVNGQTLSWVRRADGQLSHCSVSDTEGIANMPEDFLFHYVGEVGDMRRFRLSYEAESQLTGEVEWQHIDYFDDIATERPRLLLTDDVYTEIDTIAVGSEMRDFEESGVVIPTQAEFDSCALSYSVQYGPRADAWRSVHEQYMHPENGTLYSTMMDGYRVNETHVGPVLRADHPGVNLDAEFAAWDWGTPYPPEMNGPSSVSENSIDMYEDATDPAFVQWRSAIVEDFTTMLQTNRTATSTGGAPAARARNLLRWSPSFNYGLNIDIGPYTVTMDMYAPLFGISGELYGGRLVDVSLNIELDGSSGSWYMHLYAEGCYQTVMCMTGGVQGQLALTGLHHVQMYVDVSLKVSNAFPYWGSALSFLDQPMARLQVDYYDHAYEDLPHGLVLVYKEVFLIKSRFYRYKGPFRGFVQFTGLHVANEELGGSFSQNRPFTNVAKSGRFWMGGIVGADYFSPWWWNWGWKNMFTINVFHFHFEDTRRRYHIPLPWNFRGSLVHPKTGGWGPKMQLWSM